MRSAKSLRLGFGLLLAGCVDPHTAQPDPEPLFVESADVWSGTSLTIRSAGFIDADPSAVLLDDDSLSYTRVDDSTLHVPVPDSPGSHELRVVSSLVQSTPVSIKLNGFLSASEGPVFQGRAVRGAYLTELYGNGPLGLRRWNVSTGATYDYPDSMHDPRLDGRGVGRGTHLGELVLMDPTDGRWQVWRVEPTVEHLGTARCVGGCWFVDQRSQASILAGHHHTYVAPCDSCPTQTIRSEEPQDIVYSPNGTQALVLAWVGIIGTSVFDPQTGQSHYLITSVQSALGAVFSDGSDTLFLAALDSLDNRPLLLALRAANGALIKKVELPFWPCGVALDPLRPLLYAAGFMRGTGKPILTVFDRATLEPIAQLAADPNSFDFPCIVLPSPLERRVYVAWTWGVVSFQDNGHALVARFETPPY